MEERHTATCTIKASHITIIKQHTASSLVAAASWRAGLRRFVLEAAFSHVPTQVAAHNQLAAAVAEVSRLSRQPTAARQMLGQPTLLGVWLQAACTDVGRRHRSCEVSKETVFVIAWKLGMANFAVMLSDIVTAITHAQTARVPPSDKSERETSELNKK